MTTHNVIRLLCRKPPLRHRGARPGRPTSPPNGAGRRRLARFAPHGLYGRHPRDACAGGNGGDAIHLRRSAIFALNKRGANGP